MPTATVRGAVTDEKSLITRSWWRPPGSEAWMPIGEYGMRDAQTFPVAFDGDGSMIVASNVGRDTYALYRYDPVKNAPGAELVAYPRADFATGIVYDRWKKRIVGLRYDAERAGAAWFDDEWARIQASVDKALPDTVNRISRGEDKRVPGDVILGHRSGHLLPARRRHQQARVSGRRAQGHRASKRCPRASPSAIPRATASRSRRT